MIIKIFAAIGIVFAVLIMANFLCYAEEKIKKWRENDCKIKMLCNPHVYEYYWMWPNGELILKCKKCGKIKRLRVDVENWNKIVVIPYGEPRYTTRSYSVWNIYAESDYTKMYKRFYDIGISVFLSEEAAKEKLKELEDSHDQR